MEVKKVYNLEERTFEFAKAVRIMVSKLHKTISNIEDGKQVVRSSGSVGANYIEANESLSVKDFEYRIRVCRKEAKESTYWLRLIESLNKSNESPEIESLIAESLELRKILTAILEKSKRTVQN
jgi:four helix bundle protein